MHDRDQVIFIQCFSDILCVWAYVAQIRLDELKKKHGVHVRFSYHFLPLFGSTASRIEESWGNRGGLKGYGSHVSSIGARYDHIQIHPRIWIENTPRSSASCHHVLKGIQLLEQRGVISDQRQPDFDDRTIVEEAAWRLRLAFFRDLRDVSTREVQFEVVEALRIPTEPLIDVLRSGAAMATLFDDFQARDKFKVTGSPTLVLNEGRQILYGNLGFRLIDANVEELLRHPEAEASWC
jgi:predicted DsbA family dithiol-disulfide isomerase